MRISDWSSDVCSSDLGRVRARRRARRRPPAQHDAPSTRVHPLRWFNRPDGPSTVRSDELLRRVSPPAGDLLLDPSEHRRPFVLSARRMVSDTIRRALWCLGAPLRTRRAGGAGERSEEHTSELQSLLRLSYADFCLKTTKQTED